MKKNGFTLIEVLGVIVLLSVIALITVPVISNVMVEARKNAGKASALEYIKAIEFSLSRAKIDADPSNDVFYFPNDTYTNISAPVKGKKPMEVTLTIEAGEVISGTIKYPDYTYTISGRKVVAVSETIIHAITNELCFEFDDVTQTITKYYLPADYDETYPLPESAYSICTSDLVIPDTIEGIEVKRIGNFSLAYNGLTSVVISDNVEVIEGSAFANNYITNIVWGSGINDVEPYAFNNNELPDNQAFIYARNPDTSIDNTRIVSYGGAKRANITIPSNVIVIGSSAFIANEITSITIPNSVVTIEADAFMFNDLNEIVIPSSVTTIETRAFAYNDLTNIVIPSSVTSIGSAAFTVNKLPDNQAFIYARNSNGSIDNTYLISYGGINKNVTIPNNVTKIGASSFRQTNITSVVIPSSVTLIDAGAFSYNSLTNVIIPNSVTVLMYAAFANNQLTSVDIGTGVTFISSNAFQYNYLTTPTTIIRKASGTVGLGTNVFANNGPTKTTTITPTYIP